MIARRTANHYTPFISRRLLFTILTAWTLFSTAPARAHSPFDSNARITVLEQNLEASLVVGTGLTEQLLKDSGVGPLSNTGVGPGTPLPLTVAPRLFALEVAGTNLPASQLRVLSDGLEATFIVIYPRPAASTFHVHAKFAEHLPASGFSALVVTDGQNRMLGSHIVRRGSETADFNLPKLSGSGVETVTATTPSDTVSTPTTVAATSIAKVQPSFAEYFQMGVHHILTGPDHLLFLCGLLVVSRKSRDVLAIITCFTLAHSVTLALAALNVMSLSARIVEPIIAASIIFVGAENFRKDQGVKIRCGLAFGFGLIHGFGLADALREAGLGATIGGMLTGLLSFNLGVEAGQLAVAALFLAVLWQLRKFKPVECYATQTISVVVIALGGWWLLQRTLLS